MVVLQAPAWHSSGSGSVACPHRRGLASSPHSAWQHARIPKVASNPSAFGDRSGSDPSSSSSGSSAAGTSTTRPRAPSSSTDSSSSPPPPSGEQPLQPLQPQVPELDALLLAAIAPEVSSDADAADAADAADSAAAGAAGWAATIGVVAGISILLGGGYVFRGEIKTFLDFFIQAVDDWGVWGYVAYAAVYTGLEVLAVPAIPLTMTAGAIFGPLPGTIVVSFSSTVAATIAFLIARYAARDKIAKLAYKNKRFAAIDRAISRNGLKFVTLLRLSPLLPLAASNYLYGLTSVDVGSYVLGSWLGMLPGTYAYVTAGHVGKAVLTEGEGSFGVEGWQVGLALGATALALGFIGRLAQQAVLEADQEVLDEQAQRDAAAAATKQAATKQAADAAPRSGGGSSGGGSSGGGGSDSTQ